MPPGHILAHNYSNSFKILKHNHLLLSHIWPIINREQAIMERTKALKPAEVTSCQFVNIQYKTTAPKEKQKPLTQKNHNNQSQSLKYRRS